MNRFSFSYFQHLRCTILFALPIFFMHAANAAEKLPISGTGAALPAIELIADEFYLANPKIKPHVITPPLGSGGAIKALIAGKIEIAFTARLPKESELAKQALLVKEYAKTPFVFATHESLQTHDFSLNDFAAMYSGSMQEWPEGKRLRLILRPASDSDVDLLRSMSAEMSASVISAIKSNKHAVASTDYSSADLIEKIPGAIGTSTLALMQAQNRALKPLAVNGVTPTLTSIQKGEYPYAKTFFIVTSTEPSPSVRQFVDFFSSQKGQEILKQNGHWVTLR